jgi:EmrB/QacA subfamily drug resistance transporter
LTPCRPASERGRWIAAVAIIGQLIVVVDIAVVNVASQAIRADLGFSAAAVQWVASVYTVTFAGLLIVGGRLADVYGSRRVFLLSLLAFCVMSAVSGLAPSPAVLIVARGLQGCCAAVMSPVTLTIIMRQLAGPQRNRAVGTWASMSGVGGGLGVFLGGLLTQTLSWRWIFFINIPVGAVILAMGWVAVDRDVPRGAARQLDIWGAATLTLAMLSLVFGIVEAGTEGWLSDRAIASFGVAVVAAASCWWIESRVAPRPVIPSWVAGDRVIAGTNVVLLLLYMVIIAPWFLLSFYMQIVLGLDPLQAGVGLLPQAVIIAATAQAGSWAARRYHRGIRVLSVAGPLFATAGMLVMWWEAVHAGPAGYVPAVLVPLILLGLAVGLTLPAATIAATRSSAAAESGLVAGLLNTSRQFGAALGLSIVYTAGTAHAAPRTGSHLPAGYVDAALLGTFIALAAAAAAFALIRGIPSPAGE